MIRKFICRLLAGSVLTALSVSAAFAQWSSGQLLTAAALNYQFALYVPIAGGTLTGPLTVPTLTVSNALSATNSQITGTASSPGSLSIENQVIGAAATLGFGTTTWSPAELEISNNATSDNVLHLISTSPTGISAMAFRGTDSQFNPNPSAVNEHMAIGWSNHGSLDFMEFSNYNAGFNPAYAPPHVIMQQTGGIDPTGGTAIQCNTTAGSVTLSCAGPVPAAASSLYVEGYGILDNTQIASGGGTSTPTLTNAATQTITNSTIHFWTPSYSQRQFFSAERDNQVYFNYWDGMQAVVVNRASSQEQVGVYGGQLSSVRQILGNAITDAASTRDRFILWNSTSTSAKTETIPGCTTPALVASGSPSTAGQTITIVDEAVTAGAYPITVNPTTGQINFGSSAVISQNSGSLTLTCDGAGNWVTASPATGSFGALSASGAVGGAGFSNYLASPPAIGGATANAGTFTTVNANTSVNANGSYYVFSRLVLANVSPGISSGFGAGSSIGANTGAIGFKLTIGTGGTATSGVLSMPTASNGWNCYANDITTQSSTVFSTKMTASTTTSVTLTNFNTSGAAAAWAANDTLVVSCVGF
ncbi:hypothetical protein B0G62_10443 [Paraburkholderia eburnea]|uniref:Uncharacterized protein n=1 Tax=Paraburkholderia eburnea TaxID=1189126 RepID=A0A2S4MDC4_9BURK|nr:hypothetical protein [Paraburkholderia eburnea]POR52746.1 hypothetical protein B0G62_10443 [Paraburkholderia eburnea]PRZ23614.1 hypothetical protein BX588_10443 [Paraburkholderia eburnea]